MIIRSHINTLFNSVSYRIANVLVDPGDEWEGFNSVDAVLLTHAHFDHIYGINRVLEINPLAKVYTNEIGRGMLLDAKKNLSRYHESPIVISRPNAIVTVKDNEELNLGNGIIVKSTFTPGHNPSCISWIIGDNIFTGDSYIPGIKTVTNLPGANKNRAVDSEEILRELGGKYKIYPGHFV